MISEPAERNEEASVQWAVRIDRGLTPAEQEELARWIGDDSKREGALLRAQAAWSELDRARALAGMPTTDMMTGDEADSRWLSRRRILRAGAGLMAGAMAAGFAGWFFYPASDAYSTTVGEIRRLPLADGSLTTMNSASDIRVLYSTRRRDIELENGEAWFRVAKNKARPFVVASGSMRVEAVGTEFDVRRYAGFSEVVVNEGVVKIWSTTNHTAPIEAPAGYHARVDERGHVRLSAISGFDMERQLAWREGRIILDDMTLSAAAAEFNRYSNTSLVIDPALANSRLVGSFQLDDLDGFVNASAQLVGGRVERAGKIIRIVQD